MTSDPETAETPVEAPKKGSNRNRNILIVAALVVLVVDVLAFIAFPPQNKQDPGAPYVYPVDFIKSNVEPLIPHVVWDPDPSSPPASGLITFDVTISASLFTMWIVMAIGIVLVLAVTRRRREIPGPFQNAFEYVYEGMSGFALSIGGPKAKAFIPLFMSFFVLIILSNWSGLVPPVGKVDFLRAPTSDVNVTLGLALVAFFSFHFSGMRALGVGPYFGKYFSLREFRNGAAAGVIALFVGLMEFILEFVKPITLAMRLFGNIYGGELALAVITSLTIALIPVPLIALETFVGFVQALIFSVLTIIFTMLAIEGHHEEEHDAHDVVEEMPDAGIGPTWDTLAPTSGNA